MKKILFIMDSFPLGGISKSLLALLHEIEGKCEVDLLLMRYEGLFIPLIPPSVSILKEPINPIFRNPHPRNILKAYRELPFGQWMLWIKFSLSCILYRIFIGFGGFINYMDTWIAKHSMPIDKKYDAAIAYQGGRCIYYLVEKVKSSIKIGYVHSNYSVNKTDFVLKHSDKKYFPQLKTVVTISDICLKSLQNEFPNIANKCCVIENICSPKMIYDMAVHGNSYDDNFNGIRIVTMGRFDIHIKGMDLALHACKLLKSKNIVFRWYWLGDGEQRSELQKMIDETNVADVFVLLGAKTNPYPYIKDADIYVQPSRIEGKSVALDEVKSLAKPIVVTKFDSVYDQFTDKQTALFCEMSGADIEEKILELIFNKNLKDRLVSNLKHEKVGNEEQSLIFEKLIGI